MRSARFLVPLAFLLACSSDDSGGAPALLGASGTGGTGGSSNTGASSGTGGSETSAGNGGASVAGSGGSGATGGTVAGGAAGTMSGGAAGAAGPKFPLTLTPLTAAQTKTANMSLFFSLVDANGEPVIGFDGDDFEVREDDAPIAKNESDFQVSALSGQTLDIPTVILLDLSNSTVASGKLGEMKTAATNIVKAALPEQSLALVTFADASSVRVSFTKDRNAVLAAIDNIKDEDGLSTNLYGAVSEALGLWSDGFVGAGSTGRLTSGFVLVITDGADTAGVKTIDQVIAQRGAKRIITVGVTNDVNTEALQKLGNAGYIPTASFDTLVKDVDKINAASQALGKSIYRASYCSPKLAGKHELLFYPKGNPIPTEGGKTCAPAVFTGPVGCKDPGYVPCGAQGSGCCGPATPYACAATSQCYATPDAAAEACGKQSCVMCTPYQEGGSSGSTLAPGPFLEVPFNADGHSTKQCPAAWGPSCKALADCCGTLPTSTAQQCADKTVALLGEEASCTQSKQQYCPAFTGDCATYKTCCESLTNENERTSCLSQATSYATSSNQSACKSSSQQTCPGYGPACTQLKACCATLGNPNDRKDCEQDAKLIAAGGADFECMSVKNDYCPAGSGGAGGGAGAGGAPPTP